MSPQISLVVPVFNSEKFLTECIESILLQTYENIQVVLIDDGSTDASLDICIKFSLIDKRIKVIATHNQGVANARNVGILNATGDYIGFIDSDDHVLRNYCEFLLKKLTDDNAQCVAMVNHCVNIFNLKCVAAIDNKLAIRELLALRFPTSVWAYMYKAELIRDMRMNQRIHFFEDFEFNCRVIMRAEKISLTRESLYIYRQHNESANSSRVSNKKLTCLDIYDGLKDEIMKFGGVNYLNRATYFRSHFLVGLISILESTTSHEMVQITQVLRKKSKEIFSDVIYSQYTPALYKIAITLSAIDVRIFPFVLRPLFKFFRKKYRWIVGVIH